MKSLTTGVDHHEAPGSRPAELGFGQAIRILLIDDQATVRAGLRMLLDSRMGLRVIGETGVFTEAVGLAERQQPDLILLDRNLGGVDGLDLVRPLLNAAPETRVLMLMEVADDEAHRRAVRLGVAGIFLKEQSSELLFKAVERVYAGEVWLDRTLTANVLSELVRPGEGRQQDPEVAKMASLTDREREVIALVGEGLKNKQIAERLFISDTTVRHHLTSIFDKLAVPDRLGLVIYAYRHGLVKLPNEGKTGG